jgi:hypothetical protein
MRKTEAEMLEYLKEKLIEVDGKLVFKSNPSISIELESRVKTTKNPVSTYTDITIDDLVNQYAKNEPNLVFNTGEVESDVKNSKTRYSRISFDDVALLTSVNDELKPSIATLDRLYNEIDSLSIAAKENKISSHSVTQWGYSAPSRNGSSKKVSELLTSYKSAFNSVTKMFGTNIDSIIDYYADDSSGKYINKKDFMLVKELMNTEVIDSVDTIALRNKLAFAGNKFRNATELKHPIEAILRKTYGYIVEDFGKTFIEKSLPKGWTIQLANSESVVTENGMLKKIGAQGVSGADYTIFDDKGKPTVFEFDSKSASEARGNLTIKNFDKKFPKGGTPDKQYVFFYVEDGKPYLINTNQYNSFREVVQKEKKELLNRRQKAKKAIFKSGLSNDEVRRINELVNMQANKVWNDLTKSNKLAPFSIADEILIQDSLKNQFNIDGNFKTKPYEYVNASVPPKLLSSIEVADKSYGEYDINKHGFYDEIEPGRSVDGGTCINVATPNSYPMGVK